MIQETSLLAYMDCSIELNNKEQEIYDHLRLFGPSCIADISNDLKMRTSTVSARLNDLLHKDLVERIEKRPSKTTNIKAIFHRAIE